MSAAQNQKGYAFELRDTVTNDLIPNVSCQVVTAQGKLLSYALSDAKGRASLKASADQFIVFTLLGYQKQRIKVTDISASSPHIIFLAPKTVKLREVFVKVPPIRSHGDTLIYNAKAFTSAGDRYLEDVLKKLPGVTVSNNGTISVQGKTINKFYIEGMDLMGKSYNQATRNMPLPAITSIEVIENHQPIKLLKDKVYSDRAALNIKIDKNYWVKPFGEAEGGIGFSPIVWNNRLFVTQILENSQLLFTGKMNNTGKDLSSETAEHIDPKEIETYEPQPASVLNSEFGMENLPLERYNYNKSYSGGLNYITKLSKDATLRLNLLAYTDHSHYDSYTENTYGGATAFKLTESQHFFAKDLTLLPILKYELNSSKTYITDEVRYSFSRRSLLTSLTSNANDVREQNQSRPSYFQNIFRSTFSVGEQTLQALSFIRFYRENEMLNDSSLSVQRYNLEAQYRTQSWMAKHNLSTTFNLFGNELSIGLNNYYCQNTYDYAGISRHSTFRLELEPDYFIKYGTNKSISIGLPLEWHKLSLNGDFIDPSSRHFLAFSPSIHWQHALSGTVTTHLSASMSTSGNEPSYLSAISLRTGYRTIRQPSNEIFQCKSQNVSFRIRYRSLVHMLFCSLGASFQNQKLESYTNLSYSDASTVISEVRGDNYRKTFNTNFSIDKTLTNLGLTIKFGTNYNLSSALLSQSELLMNNHSHTFSTHLGLDFSKLSWLRLGIDNLFNVIWQKNEFASYYAYKNYSLDTSLFLFPTKRWEVRGNYQLKINEIAPSQFKSCGLVDVSSHYKLNKIFEFGVSLSNLLNMQDYILTQTSGIDTYYSCLPLRGRQYLASVIVHF